MHLEVQTVVFIPALISMTVLCPRSQASSDSPSASHEISDVTPTSKVIPDVTPTSKVIPDVLQNNTGMSAPEFYVHALETFDVTNPLNLVHCCSTLTSAIQALLRDTDARRWDQLTAPLFAFVNARKDLFPDAQYRLNFYLPYLPRIDAMFQRNDGTVFVFSWNLHRLCRAIHSIQRRQGTELHYRPLRREVKHTVLVALFFDKLETGRYGKLRGVNARFLVDTFDEKKEVNINVTVQSGGRLS